MKSINAGHLGILLQAIRQRLAFSNSPGFVSIELWTSVDNFLNFTGRRTNQGISLSIYKGITEDLRSASIADIGLTIKWRGLLPQLALGFEHFECEAEKQDLSQHQNLN